MGFVRVHARHYAAQIRHNVMLGPQVENRSVRRFFLSVGSKQHISYEEQGWMN